MRIPPQGQLAVQPRIASDAQGDVTLVWVHQDTPPHPIFPRRVETRTWLRGGGLSPVQALSAWSAEHQSPEVAVDTDGDAVFAWDRRDGTTGCDPEGPGGCWRTRGRARSATGALSPGQTLSIAGQHAIEPQVAVDADGDAVFAWKRVASGDPESTTGQVDARARSATGTLSPIQTLSHSGAEWPQLAIDADGDALAVWDRSDSLGARRIQARARSASGTLSPTQTLSVPNASYPEIASDAEGDALVAWQRDDGTTGCSGGQSFTCTRIEARARSATGALGPIQTLSAPGQDTAAARVAVDRDGDAVVVWLTHSGSSADCCWRAQARTRSAAGTLGPIQTLSDGGQNASSAKVAVDAVGNAVFVWQRPDCPFPSSCLRIQARTRSAAGTLGPVENLSGQQNAGDGNGFATPQLAIDSDGDAIAAWVASVDGPLSVYAARGP